MVYKKEILLLFACFFVTSCNVSEFKQFKFNSEEYYFTFNQNIPTLLKEKIIFLNGSNTNNNEEKIEVNIIQYNLRTYEIYSGAALRAIEKEIKATLTFSVKENASMHMNHNMNMDHKMNSKSINAMWGKIKQKDFDLIIDDGCHQFEGTIKLQRQSSIFGSKCFYACK